MARKFDAGRVLAAGVRSALARASLEIGGGGGKCAKLRIAGIMTATWIELNVLCMMGQCLMCVSLET